MHSLFELLLISFSIASSRTVHASLLPDNVDFVPYLQHDYLPRDDGKLVSELIGREERSLEERSLGGMSMNELFARQAGPLKADLQTFTGALGGIRAPPITQSGNQERPYQVQGNTFPNYMEAATRTCDIQSNNCADMVNTQGAADDGAGDDGDASGGQDAAPVQQPTTRATSKTSTTHRSSTTSTSTQTQQNGGNNDRQQNGGNNQPRQGNNNGNGTANAGNQKRQNRVTMNMCQQQMSQCNTVVRAAAITSFDLQNLGPDPNDPDFDLLCQ